MPTITRDHAADLYGEGNPTPDAIVSPWRYVGTQHVRTSRWAEVYWLVVADPTGALYGVEYREGLTENQENELPWEDDGPPLPMVALAAHEVTKTEYREATS